MSMNDNNCKQLNTAMAELEKLQAEFASVLKVGEDMKRAKKLKEEIQQKIDLIRERMDTYEVRLRERIAAEYNYDYVSAFSPEGYAIGQRGGWGGGEYDPIYSLIRPEQEIIDRNGNIVLGDKDINTKGISALSDGMAIAQDVDGDHLYDLKTGKRVLIEGYVGSTRISNFQNGMAMVTDGVGCWYINKEGKRAVPGYFKGGAAHFSEGLAAVSETFAEHKYIDETGEQAIQGTFANANSTFIGDSNFSDGFALVRQGPGSEYFFIDHDGNKAFGRTFSVAHGFSGGAAPVREADGRWYFIDTTGKRIGEKGFSAIAYKPNDAPEESEGFVPHPVSPQGVAFFDRGGEMMFGEIFDRVCRFRNGVAMVWKGDEWFFIDRTGKRITDKTFTEDDMGPHDEFQDGVYELAPDADGRRRFIDKRGKPVFEKKKEE